jgi:hypothetical protein
MQQYHVGASYNRIDIIAEGPSPESESVNQYLLISTHYFTKPTAG